MATDQQAQQASKHAAAALTSHLLATNEIARCRVLTVAATLRQSACLQSTGSVRRGC